MKKFNLNFKFKDLAGKEINLSPANEIVSDNISDYLPSPEEDDLVLKYFNWAELLSKGDDLIMDEPDYKKFKTLIEEKLNLTNIAKAQIFEAIEKCLKEKDK